MESMEKVFFYEAKARQKKMAEYKKLLTECSAVMTAMNGLFVGLTNNRNNEASQKMQTIIDKVNLALEDDHE